MAFLKAKILNRKFAQMLRPPISTGSGWE